MPMVRSGDRSVVTTSADRQTISTQIDANGDGHVDTTQATVRNPDGSMAAAVTDVTSNGTLRDKTVVTTSADGLSTTTQRDTTGAGTFNQTQTDVTVLNTDGSSTETITDFNADGSLRDKSIQTTSADGLSTTTQSDVCGAGSFNHSLTDVTVLNTDGSRTETISDFNADGSLKDRTVTTTSADGLSMTTRRDTTGSGSFDQTFTDVIVPNGNNNTTTIVNADGTSSVVVTDTSNLAGWKTFTTTFGADGAMLSQTGVNDGGSSWSNVYDAAGTASFAYYALNVYDGNGQLVSQTGTNDDGTHWLTANDTAGTNEWSTFTITYDADWNVVSVTGTNHDSTQAFDPSEAFAALDTLVWFANPFDPISAAATAAVSPDGGQTETVTETNADGSICAIVTTITAAGGRAREIETDIDGDGTFDRIETVEISANGDIVDTLTTYGPEGNETGQTVTTTSADGPGRGPYNSI